MSSADALFFITLMERQQAQRERTMSNNHNIHTNAAHSDYHHYGHDEVEVIQPPPPLSRDHPHTPSNSIDFTTRAIILASILTPIAFVPYLVVRKQLISLGTKASDATFFSAALRREVKGALSNRHYEHEQLAGLLKGLKGEQEAFTANVTKSLLGRTEKAEALRRDLDEVKGGLLDMRMSLAERHNTWTSLGKTIQEDVGQMRQGLDELRTTVQGLVQQEVIRVQSAKVENLVVEPLAAIGESVEDPVKVETMVEEDESSIACAPRQRTPIPNDLKTSEGPVKNVGMQGQAPLSAAEVRQHCPDCDRRSSCSHSPKSRLSIPPISP